MPNRIPVNQLRSLKKVLFDKARFSGADFARLIGANPNTFWTWFHIHGLEPENARKLKDAIYVRVEELSWAAEHLDRLASVNEE